MEQEQFRKSAYDMIYLTSCALNSRTPDITRVSEMDLDGLFFVCQKHSLTACVAYALEDAGVSHRDFSQAKAKAIRKNILLDSERQKILNRLEQEQIWYMPLKGSILKDWYPKLGMRQMSDNDILFDAAFRAKVKKIMLDLDFVCKYYGVGNNDVYFKAPVCNFEMHHELFSPTDVGNLYNYYSGVKNRIVKDDNNAYGYHFRTEDFYIYVTAHEYKHFSEGGTGLRSLADIYIFVQKFGNTLDRDYIQSESLKLEFSEFERQSRELAIKLFTDEPLTEQDKEMLDYYIFSGTYGNISNTVHNTINKKGLGSKKKYIFYRIFPPIEHYKVGFPWAYKHKWLIPVAWMYRIIRSIFTGRKKLRAEIRNLNNTD